MVGAVNEKVEGVTKQERTEHGHCQQPQPTSGLTAYQQCGRCQRRCYDNNSNVSVLPKRGANGQLTVCPRVKAYQNGMH